MTFGPTTRSAGTAIEYASEIHNVGSSAVDDSIRSMVGAPAPVSFESIVGGWS